MKYYCQEQSEVLQSLNASREKGLTSTEASARLEKNGRNKLAEGKKKSLVRRFMEQLADPMIIILIVAAVISGVLAVVEKEFPTDVIIIMAVVIINAVLGVFQESKAEKAIEALQQMAAATSKVLRDGKVISVPSEELVVGDIVLLEAGDAVPADGRILESASLRTRFLLRKTPKTYLWAIVKTWCTWAVRWCTAVVWLWLRRRAWIRKWAKSQVR